MNILKFLAKGLFSNTVIINESKEKKWWLTFLILILSILLSILPTFTSIINYSGSDILNNSSLQLDYSLQRLSHEYLSNSDDAKLVFEIVDGKLNVKKSIDDLENKKEIVLKSKETISYLEIKRDDEITLLVSYVKYDEENEKDTYEKLSDKSEDVFNRLAGNALYNVKDSENKSHMYSTLLFFEESFSIRLYDNSATTEYSFNENNEISLSKSASVSASMSGLYETVSTQNKNLNLFDNTNPEKIKAKWKSFFDESYSAIKNQSILINCSVYSSLNVFIVLFMSLMLFIMTRFKTSLCGKQSFGTCLKFVSFAALCPALLSLLTGYILPAFQSISFLTFIGLRSIFLSTRLTKGEIQNNNQTVKK